MTMDDTTGAAFRVHATTHDGRAELVVAGELDLATAPMLRSELQSVIEGGADDVVIDMTDVGFVDSAGLGVLIGAVGRLRERGGHLALRHLQAAPRKVIDITGLQDVFELD
jgi:anti-sigma B factor antagonist